MLNLIRTHKRLMLVILILLVFPSFALWGIQSYMGMGAHASNEVARVAGVSVTTQMVESRVQRLQTANPDADPQVFSSPEFKQQVMAQLIGEQLRELAAHDDRLFISDHALRLAMRQDPNIRSLLKPDGQMDMEKYRAALQSAGRTPQQFENQVRERVMTERLMASVMSGFASQADVEQLVRRIGTRYVVRQQVLAPEAFTAKVDLSAQEIEAYYKAHEDRFMEPERADIEYVVLDVNAYMARLTISPEDVRKYYETNINLYSQPEQRRASHILVEVAPNATPEARKAAQEKAQALLAQVRKDPAQFAAIAKANSDDKGTANSGGDLGYFGRGAMLAPFDEAVFALAKTGDVSEVVETDAGYHIIELTGVRAAQAVPFEDVRSKVEHDLRQQMANQQFGQVAEEFRNDVYVNAGSLEPVAQKFGLTVEKAQGVLPTVKNGASGALASEAFLTALFDPNTREAHQNIQAQEIGPSQLASGRVVTYTPPALKPFDAVRAQVKEMAAHDKAVALAQEAGAARLAQWQASPDEAAKVPEMTVSYQQMAGLAPEVQHQVFSLLASELPKTLGVPLANGGYAVVQVERTEAPDENDPRLLGAVNAMLLNASVGAQEQAYMGYLQERYNVKVYPEVFKAMIQQQQN